MHKFNEIINGNHPFTYEMVLRSNVTGVVDAAYHPDIIFSKGGSCATIRYGGTTIGVYICNSAGNWSDTLFNTSFNTSQYGNQFTTVTGTYSPENGGTLTVYFNGEPICTLPNVGSVKPSDFDLWIGKDPENPGRTGSGDDTGDICCKSCHAGNKSIHNYRHAKGCPSKINSGKSCNIQSSYLCQHIYWILRIRLIQLDRLLYGVDLP